MREILHGCWRGVVVAEDDPSKRGRVRVRIPQLHAPEVPDDQCPWSELGSFGGDGHQNGSGAEAFGDFHNYHVGDRVWVMFEGGNPLYPVVFAGWFVRNAYPLEFTSDYPGNRKRWRRVSRTGDFIEMDDREGHQRIHLRSGNTEIELNRATQVITIHTPDKVLIQGESKVRIECEAAEVETETAAVHATDLIQVRADGGCELTAQHITLASTTTVMVTAATSVTVQANAAVNIIAPAINFSAG